MIVRGSGATSQSFDPTDIKTMTTIWRLGVILVHAVPLLTVRRGADTMGMAAPIYWTADMVRQLPDDGNRYEVVYGELLVTPAPRLSHQLMVSRLFHALAEYLAGEPVGIVLTSPADISWGRDDVLVQPDLFVVPVDEVRTGDWSRLRSLRLAIEVLSPSTTRADRFTKRRRYQEARLPAYWVVDGADQSVEVWTPDAEFPVVERQRLGWHPAGAGQPFTLELAELFRPV